LRNALLSVAPAGAADRDHRAVDGRRSYKIRVFEHSSWREQKGSEVVAGKMVVADEKVYLKTTHGTSAWTSFIAGVDDDVIDRRCSARTACSGLPVMKADRRRKCPG